MTNARIIVRERNDVGSDQAAERLAYAFCVASDGTPDGIGELILRGLRGPVCKATIDEGSNEIAGELFCYLSRQLDPQEVQFDINRAPVAKRTGDVSFTYAIDCDGAPGCGGSWHLAEVWELDPHCGRRLTDNDTHWGEWIAANVGPHAVKQAG